MGSIRCNYGRDQFCAGTIFVAYLKFSSSTIPADLKFSCFAYGIVTLDNKWLKSSKRPVDSFGIAPTTAADDLFEYPQFTNHNTFCIFLTTKHIISAQNIHDSGIFVTFDLPLDCIPSYKGLCGSIKYNLELTIRSELDNLNKKLQFPFTVIGTGSDQLPHLLR